MHAVIFLNVFAYDLFRKSGAKCLKLVHKARNRGLGTAYRDFAIILAPV